MNETSDNPYHLKTMKNHLTVLVALLASAFMQLRATDLAQQKLFGHWVSNPANYQLGYAVALSSSYAVVGTDSASEGSVLNQGAVQVFNATTGAFVRKILPPAPAAENSLFGIAVAISGKLAAIGAPGVSGNLGRVYVYDVSTGALKFTFFAEDGTSSDRFGYSVAMTSSCVLVGADQKGGKGAVYVYNLSNGSTRFETQASDGAASDKYGFSVAAEGNIGIVGAPFADSSKGAIYVIDLTTGSEIVKHQPAGLVAPDRAGAAVSVHQGKVAIGTLASGAGKAFVYDITTNTSASLSPLDPSSGSSFGAAVSIHGGVVAVGSSSSDSSRGSVYLFDAATQVQLQKTMAFDNSPDSSFGYSVSLDGSNLLVGAWDDASLGNNAGAAYLEHPITTAMPFTKAMAKGDGVPAAPDTTYYTLGEAFINNDGKIALTSTLTGAGSNGGHDVGAYSDFKNVGFMDSILKTRQFVGPGITVTALPRIICNHKDYVCGIAQLNPTKTSFWVYTSSGPQFGIYTGDTTVFGSTILSLGELVQSNLASAKYYALNCKLKLGAGTVTTTATNDSAVVAANLFVSGETTREGVAAPTSPTTNYGEFTGRLAFFYSRYLYSSALTGASATNAGIFQKAYGSAAVKVVQKGDPPADITATLPVPPTFSSFIGETEDDLDTAVYRATIAGTGITSSNNEGLWTRTTGGTTHLALRKDQLITGLIGVKLSKIVNFWSASSRVIALVQLTGTGVSSANDMALVQAGYDGTNLQVLMREGEAAAGCAPATIGTISRVEFDAWTGTYAVLTTLSGAPTGTEQALFTGSTLRGNDTTKQTLRRPFLRLRKGQLFNNQPGKVKSISLPTSNITASGAGCTGRGRAISYAGDLAITVEFDNGVRQVMRGTVY